MDSSPMTSISGCETRDGTGHENGIVIRKDDELRRRTKAHVYTDKRLHLYVDAELLNPISLTVFGGDSHRGDKGAGRWSSERNREPPNLSAGRSLFQ
jgi:hypothetical protein